MDNQFEKIISELVAQFLGYLPSFTGGILLIGFGLLLGWIAKRVTVRLAMVLRLDRLFLRFRWGAGLSKGDIRYAFFNSIGNMVYVLVFLILLTASLDVLKLRVLSELIRSGVLFVPRLIIGLIIAGIGWLVAGWSAVAIQNALVKEEVPRAMLISRFTRAVVMLFFTAMALTEFNVARDIIVIGFTVTIVTLGVISIVLAVLGGKAYFHRLERNGQ